jgi:hypothetical protein
VVDRHFWRQHKKIEIKNTAPIFGEKTPKSLHNSLCGQAPNLLKKKREHGIDE